MGLKLTTGAPQEGFQVVSDALNDLSRARPVDLTSAAGSGPAENRELIDPQMLYQIGLDDMAREDPLAYAAPVAWRYLVVENEQPVEAAETTLGGAGQPVTFSRVNRGPQVAGFVEAVHAAEATADEQPEREWELRYLRIPALYVDALWLHDDANGEDGGDDLLLPIRPVFPPLQADQAYTAADFFQQLRGRAEDRLGASDDDNG